MTQVLRGTLFILLIAVAIPVSVSAQNPTNDFSNYSELDRLPLSTIDSIHVPFRIIQAVQLEYQGFAVVGVHQLGGNPAAHYRVRISQDDRSSGGKYLYFNEKWQLLKQQEIIIPSPKPVQTAPAQPLAHSEEPQEEADERGDDRRDRQGEVDRKPPDREPPIPPRDSEPPEDEEEPERNDVRKPEEE